MSKESDTTDLHGVTLPNSERRFKRPTYEQMREKGILEVSQSELDRKREIYMRELRKEQEDYLNQCPYDAKPPPLGLGGIVPVAITDEYRPLLRKCSQFALDYYNNKEGNSGASCFEFHDFVKLTYLFDTCPNAHAPPRRLNPTVYYITFQAKPKGDPSQDITTTFQAKVLVDRYDQDKPPVVEECRIKI